ncbi:hypothetical protein GW17_00047124, partial [Ensete ventricosum]
MVWATYTIDNALPTLSMGKAEGSEKIQMIFSFGAMEHEKEAHSMEATCPPTLSDRVACVIFILMVLLGLLLILVLHVEPYVEEGPTMPYPTPVSGIGGSMRGFIKTFSRSTGGVAPYEACRKANSRVSELDLELSLAPCHAEEVDKRAEDAREEAMIAKDMVAESMSEESVLKEQLLVNTHDLVAARLATKEIASGRFKARYPKLEVDEDPFVELPSDVEVPALAEIPFNDCLTYPPTLPPLLGIMLGSDDVVGPHWEFARRFAEGIGKLTGNTPGDCRKKTRGLTARMLEAVRLVG